MKRCNLGGGLIRSIPEAAQWEGVGRRRPSSSPGDGSAGVRITAGVLVVILSMACVISFPAKGAVAFGFVLLRENPLRIVSI